MDDFGNEHDPLGEAFNQWIGSILSPYGFFIEPYWPWIEGM
jgi:hypothetical protein